jgi:hypothetical protein
MAGGTSLNLGTTTASPGEPEEHGDKRGRHHLCISHFLLPVFPMVKRFQEVVTDTIDRQDVVVHGGPPRAGVGG